MLTFVSVTGDHAGGCAMPVGLEATAVSHFILEVAGMQAVSFPTCSGLGSTSEVIEHKITDELKGEIIRKIPGRLIWSNLVLKRGVSQDKSLWAWRQLVIANKMAEARRNGTVTAMSQEGLAIKRWEFLNGWPCEWQVSSPEGASAIVVETIEIAHEGLRQL
jgi:phage tail-like protein